MKVVFIIIIGIIIFQSKNTKQKAPSLWASIYHHTPMKCFTQNGQVKSLREENLSKFVIICNK